MGTTVIDTVIGLAFMFLIVATFSSAAVEAIGNVFKKRAKYLLRGLRDLLDPAEADPSPALGETFKALLTFGRGWLAILKGFFGAIGAAMAGVVPKKETEQYQTALDAGNGDAPVAVTRAGKAKVGDAETPWSLALMGHSLVVPFKHSRPGGQKSRNPSYLPSSVVTSALLDLISPNDSGPTTLDSIRRNVADLPDTVPFKRALLAILKSAGDDIDKFRTGVEAWYDGQMDRVSGAYQRWAKRWILVISMLAAVVLHVSAINVGETLYKNGPVRDAVVAAASNDTLCSDTSPEAEDRVKCIDDELEKLNATGLEVGWHYWTTDERPDGIQAWLLLLFGFLLTGGAAALGAPFWFDALNKLGSFKTAGAKPKSEAD